MLCYGIYGDFNLLDVACWFVCFGLLVLVCRCWCVGSCLLVLVCWAWFVGSNLEFAIRWKTSERQSRPAPEEVAVRNEK